MKALLIPDKFKGSLSAMQVIDALSAGIVSKYPKAEIHSVVASDGGDGFLDSIAHYESTHTIQVACVDPLGKQLAATYLYNSEKNVAYIELAKTAGLVLLDDKKRNPLKTTTRGVGLQIADALERGAKKIFLGLGGSATNDGGIGIASVMGYQILDANGRRLEPIGENLRKIQRLISPKNKAYSGVEIYAVNDVNNPLFGKQGAANVYGAQKGANPQEIEFLDQGLRHLDKVVTRQLHKENALSPGAGAAGGTAYGLKSFLDAEFISGIDFIMELARVHNLLAQQSFDYIITGEGKIDDQTLNGKLIEGVLKLGATFNLPVIAVCGILDVSVEELKKQGVEQVLEIRDTSKSLSYNMQNAAELLEQSIGAFFQDKII